MSDQDNASVFNSSAQDHAAEQSVATATTSSTSNAYEDLLKTITAEDGRQKYQSVEDALKAMTHAQTHIRTIEEENAAIKAELDKRKTAEELLSGLRPQRTEEQPTSQPSFDPNVVEQLIEKKLEAKTHETVRKQNMDKVNAAFIAQYGDVEKAKEAFTKAAQEAGVGMDFMTDLAARSPEAVLKLAGIGVKTGSAPAKTSSSLNTAGFQKVESTKPQGSLMYASTAEVAQYWKSLAEKVA